MPAPQQNAAGTDIDGLLNHGIDDTEATDPTDTEDATGLSPSAAIKIAAVRQIITETKAEARAQHVPGYASTPIPSMEKFTGRALRDRRRQLGLRQQDVATRMGVSRGLVSQWEQGTTHIMARDLTRLAEALGVTVPYLFGEIELPNPSWHQRLHDPSNEDEKAERLRREHQEKILMSVFDAMTEEQRERLLRVAQALRD